MTSLQNSLVVFLLLTSAYGRTVSAQEAPIKFSDSNPQHYKLTARASEIDSRVKAHPDIDFLINTKTESQPTFSTLPSTREFQPEANS